ncbi:MAG: hypothetical protein HQ559_10700 [Lentisphaerae bacterium]|nr:hypothetical protein [Lentisphaerota bacterium]
MTVQLTRARARIAVDLVQRSAIVDALTNESPVFYRGNVGRFEIGVFNNETIIDSFTDIESLTVEIRSRINPEAPAYLTKTIEAASLTACIAADWTAGTGQHGLVNLSDTETDLPAQGDSVEYWLAVGAVLADGPVTLGKGILKILEDGIGGSSGSGSYPTFAEADARYMRRGIPNGSFRTDANGQHIQLYNPTTGLWHSIGCDGAEGAVAVVVAQEGEA